MKIKHHILFSFYLLAQSLFGQNFFSSTTYKGAMNTSDWTVTWTNWNPRNTSYPAPSVTVQGEITANTTWTADKTYLIKGYVYVKNNATLTIEPGTIIRGDMATTGTLVITRGAKIVANGTKTNPIIFTSSETAGTRNYGDWGGLLLLGKAKINVVGGTADVGAGINNANSDGLFGGTDNADSSGVLKYVRIEFAGVQYQPDKEIYGLTLAGCGSKTKLEYVMVSMAGNVAFRFAGGMVNAKYLIANKTLDNDFSLDLGYTGKLQFGIVQRDSTKAYADGVSCIDVQNDGLGTTASPNTFPVISNFSILGPMTYSGSLPNANYKNAILLRRNARIGLFNSAIAGFPKNILLDGNFTGANLVANEVVIQNNMISGYRTKQIDSTNKFTVGAPGISPLNWLNTASYSNVLTNNPKDLKYVKPYDYTTPVFLLGSGSGLASDANFSHTLLGGLGATKNAQDLQQHFRISLLRNGEISIESLQTTGIQKVQILDISGKIIYSQHLNSKDIKQITTPRINCVGNIVLVSIFSTTGQVFSGKVYLRD